MEGIISPLCHIPLVCGTVCIIGGLLLLKFPPKKINGIYGYRTMRSIKSQEAWDFAQQYSSKRIIKWGVILIVISLIAYFIPLSKNTSIFLGIALIIYGMSMPFVETENALKKKGEK